LIKNRTVPAKIAAASPKTICQNPKSAAVDADASKRRDVAEERDLPKTDRNGNGKIDKSEPDETSASAA
jgi:hypothetical protein